MTERGKVQTLLQALDHMGFLAVKGPGDMANRIYTMMMTKMKSLTQEEAGLATERDHSRVRTNRIMMIAMILPIM